MNNIRVYALAGKYDIPKLKDLAKSRIWDRSNRSLIENDFQDVTIEIYNSTPPGDRGLRDLILEMWRSGIEVGSRYSKWESDLRENGDLAFDILMATVSRKDAIIRKIQESVDANYMRLVRYREESIAKNIEANLLVSKRNKEMRLSYI